MNTAITSFVTPKLLACASVALALTTLLSWSFLDSTSQARWMDTPQTTQMAGEAYRPIGFDIPRAGV